MFNGTKHSLLSNSDSLHESNEILKGYDTQSRGSASTSSRKGVKMRNIKELVVHIIKEAKAFNKKGVMEILENEQNDEETHEDLEESKEYSKPDAKDIINEKSEQGWNVFHWSIYLGQLDMCTDFLKLGADLTIKTLDGWTPLQLAVYKNNIDCKLLIF